jgi:hypothetical protein
MIGEGSVGPEFSSMFSIFINNRLDKIISPQDILTKDQDYVNGALHSMVGRDDDFRADISSVIATRLVNYSLLFADKQGVPQLMIDRIAYLATESSAFTDDLKYYLIKELLNGNKPKFGKLMLNQKVAKMAIK